MPCRHHLIIELGFQYLTVDRCKIEIVRLDPNVYTSLDNHEVRKKILIALFEKGTQRPLSEQELADQVGLGYHQLIYQLNNRLRDFWTVREEKKIRGTRMELIEPADPHAVFIALGRDGKIFIVDPLAKLFGPLSKVGTRCDGCSQPVAQKCVEYVLKSCSCISSPMDQGVSILKSNQRKKPFKPVDLGVMCSLKGLASGEKCVVSIPCEGRDFLKKPIKIEGIV